MCMGNGGGWSSEEEGEPTVVRGKVKKNKVTGGYQRGKGFFNIGTRVKKKKPRKK